MGRRPDSSIVLLMIMIAIILAIGVFLAVSIILDRPEDGVAAQVEEVPQTQSSNTVNVEGQDVALSVDPNQRPVTVAEAPTAVPVQPTAVPEATQVPESGEAVPGQPQGGSGGQPANHVTFISYVVQPGDTLYRIQSNHITSIALMAKYAISASDIVVGNVLNLPVGDSAACAGWRAYVVLQGDTSFGISQWYGITLQELGARNNLDANYSIYETQVICVP